MLKVDTYQSDQVTACHLDKVDYIMNYIFVHSVCRINNYFTNCSKYLKII